MSRLPNVAFALSACVFCMLLPLVTLGQEREGPELDSRQPADQAWIDQGQETSPTIAAPSARPVWLDRPEADDLRRHFPRDALRAGVTGRVVLECLVTAEGDLLCVVVSEDPPEHGFGDAALRISESYRASMLLQDGSPAQGARVRLPVSFAVAQ